MGGVGCLTSRFSPASRWEWWWRLRFLLFFSFLPALASFSFTSSAGAAVYFSFSLPFIGDASSAAGAVVTGDIRTGVPKGVPLAPDASYPCRPPQPPPPPRPQD